MTTDKALSMGEFGEQGDWSEISTRQRLEEELGGHAREGVWNTLCDLGCVGRYEGPESYTLGDLVGEYKKTDKNLPANNLARRSNEAPPKEPVRLDTDERGRALAEILEHYIDTMPAVSDFRKKYLKRTRLASVEDAAGWLTKKMKAEALELEKGGFTFDDAGIVEAPVGFEVKPEGALASLHEAARHVESKLAPACDRRAAIICVLTGKMPLSRVLLSWRVNITMRGLSRIDLRIDPRVAPAEVAEIYREYRDKYSAWIFARSMPGRMMSSKHLRLAIFALKRDEGEPTWLDLIRSWNESCQEKRDKYQMDRQGQALFARDVKNAWERVTDIPWKHRQEISEHFRDPLWELGFSFGPGISVQEPDWQRLKPQE